MSRCPRCGQPNGLHLESCSWRHLTIGPNGETWPPPERWRLPSWVPEVRRPFNPAYRDTWEAMTHTERQWSFLLDAGLVLAVILAAGLLAGCDRRTGPPPRCLAWRTKPASTYLQPMMVGRVTILVPIRYPARRVCSRTEP